MLAAMVISSRGPPSKGVNPNCASTPMRVPPTTDSTVRLPMAPTFLALALIQFNKHRISIAHQAEDAGEDISHKGRS